MRDRGLQQETNAAREKPYGGTIFLNLPAITGKFG